MNLNVDSTRYVSMLLPKTMQMCPWKNEQSHSGYGEVDSILKEIEDSNYICPVDFPWNTRQLTAGLLSDSSAPVLVYERRNHHMNSTSVVPIHPFVNATRSGDDSLSVISDAPSIAVEDQHVSHSNHETEIVEAPVMPVSFCNKQPHSLKLESNFGSSVVEDPDSAGFSDNARMKINEVDSAIDCCSSSKSNVELVSACIRAEVDDMGECSSSSVIREQANGEDLSDRDVCISILWNEGVLKRVQPAKAHVSFDDFGARTDTSSSRSCKICSHTESSLKMLICDNCEEAFHLSCCHCLVKRVSIDEWFCNSCRKRKPRSRKETSSRKSPTIIGGKDKTRSASSRSELSPIALMLRETKAYTTGIRVGKSFQANVLDWSGPVTNDSDTIGEPSELDPLEFVSLHDFNKPCKHGSLSNWLQCREILDVPGGDGAICGKWRRAPLFEAQTDDWECFHSFLWDPFHADCAVPQELETEEIFKQLKFVKKLRPRLDAKQRKKGHPKGVNSLGNVRDFTHVYVRKRTRTK